MTDLPPTRWQLAGEARHGYGRHFADLCAHGVDVDGEARLADALLARESRVLDVGSGMGRVGEALRRRGHRVVATEPDRPLRAQSRATFPDLPVLSLEALELTAERLHAAGHPASYDLVLLVGNVMVFVAESTEQQVLAGLAQLLAPGGRMLVGFEVEPRKSGARGYPVAEFVEDARGAGLTVQHHFGSYELHPPVDDYAVLVLTASR